MSFDPERLAGMAIFRDFDARSLRAIGQLMVERRYRDGAVIAEQGGNRGGGWVVLAGQVVVERRVPNGDLVRLVTAGPGRMLGLMSLMDGLPRGARCIALGEAVCAELPRAECIELITGRTPLAMRFQLAVLRSLFADLRDTNQRLAELASLPVEQPSLEEVG